MNSFKTTYPVFTALLSLISAFALDLVTENETLIQKLENSITIVPQVLGFLPIAGGLAAELAKLKASPADIEAAAETLVTDIAFSSVKAKAIIAAAFPLAESVVALVPQVGAIVAAVKS
jgi:hypothetical protein